jgi:hypothetical protein
MSKFAKWAIFFIFAAFYCLSVFAESQIEAKVSKDKVTTGEVFTYTLKIEGDFISPQLVLPDFKDFIVVSQNQAQNYSLKGGKTTMESVLIYGLVAPKPGKFSIKEVSLKDKGKVLHGKSFTIEVSGEALKDKRKVQPYLERGTDI